MKNKNLLLITILSILACGMHAIMLNSAFNYYAYTSVFKIILFILCPIVYFLAYKEENFKDMFLKWERKGIGLSLALGFAVFTFIFVAFIILRPFLDKEMIVDAFANNGITSGNFPLVFIYVVLINAALEEIFFRGFVFMTIYRKNLKSYAHLYSCLLFAFYHVAILNNAVTPCVFILFIIGLAVAGLIFNYMAVKCNSIIGSLIVHISANMSINLIVYAYYL